MAKLSPSGFEVCECGFYTMQSTANQNQGGHPHPPPPPLFSKYVSSMFLTYGSLKFPLCGLLQKLFSTKFVHKPSFKAISYDASYTYISHGTSAKVSVSPHKRPGSISFQMVSRGEEGARHCAAVQQL